jgi:hypothetical protein
MQLLVMNRLKDYMCILISHISLEGSNVLFCLLQFLLQGFILNCQALGSPIGFRAKHTWSRCRYKGFFLVALQ